MKKLFLSLIFGVLYALTAPLLFKVSVLAQTFSESKSTQPVTEEWARRFDNKVKGESLARMAAIDGAGNVYVTGNSSSTERNKIVTIKFSPSGQELWKVIRVSEGIEFVQAITVDNAGGVFISGNEAFFVSGYQRFTTRYDAANGTESWTKIYKSDTRSSYMAANAITTDYKGGLYVSGVNETTLSRLDFITIRYDTETGAESWVNHYHSFIENGNRNVVKDITTDKDGGIYITGTQGASFVILHYNSATGTQIWANYYNNNENKIIYPSSIAVDDSGGIYVTGTIFDFNANYFTARYEASTGELSWASFFNGNSNGDDYALSIAADGKGNLFVTGRSWDDATGFDYATIRYNADNGSQMWLSRFDGGGPKSNIEEGRSIVTDDQGNVFVTGKAESPSGGSDFGTIRYDALTGNEIWSKLYNGGSDKPTWDEAVNILIDQIGGVYSIGTGHGPMRSQKGTDYVVIRYEAENGVESWVSRFGENISTYDYPISLAVDAMGNTYVTGTSWSSIGTSVIVTLKYSPTGEELWVNNFIKEGNSEAIDIALDQNGGVYVAGNNLNDNVWNMITIKYNATTGEQSWVQFYNGSGIEWKFSHLKAITTDNDGGVYITGTAQNEEGIFFIASIRYDAQSGSESWVNLYGDEEVMEYREGRDIIADETGGVYITGNILRNVSQPITIRYDAATGSQTWVSRYDEGHYEEAEVLAIAIDKMGGVFITGEIYVDPTYEYLTIGYNAETGEQRWANQYKGNTGFSESNDIATDGKGGVFVSGTSSGICTTIRYDAVSGEEIWVSLFKDENLPYSVGNAIATDYLGSVYVTGKNYKDNLSTYFTIKYNATNGKEEWLVQTEGRYEEAVDLAVDAKGNIYVTGYSLGMDTGYDFLTIKYSQCPEILNNNNISGNIAVAAGSNSSYSISAPGATTYSWNIEGNQSVSFSGQGTSQISVNWPGNPGVFKVSVNYGSPCSSQTAITYVFASDPNAGFVTGGGWINSPQNSKYELMTGGEKTHFNLNVKYRKDGQNVEGNLQLHSSTFRFVSTSFTNRSLVIAGDKAFLTGFGTLNYRGDLGRDVQDSRRFAFLLAVTDGKLNNGKKNKKKNDYFRLKIWEINSDNSMGKVLYDNQVACSPANLDHHLEACSSIGGGSIVIHKGGKKGAEMPKKAKFEELPLLEEISVYPVPFSHQINIRYQNINSFEPVKATLIGIDGKTLIINPQHLEQTEGFLVLNLRNLQLNNGLYILRLQIADEPPVVKRVLCQQ